MSWGNRSSLVMLCSLWIVASFAMQPVAFVTEYEKGRALHIPPQTDPAVGRYL